MSKLRQMTYCFFSSQSFAPKPLECELQVCSLMNKKKRFCEKLGQFVWYRYKFRSFNSSVQLGGGGGGGMGLSENESKLTDTFCTCLNLHLEENLKNLVKRCIPIRVLFSIWTRFSLEDVN